MIHKQNVMFEDHIYARGKEKKKSDYHIFLVRRLTRNLRDAYISFFVTCASIKKKVSRIFCIGLLLIITVRYTWWEKNKDWRKNKIVPPCFPFTEPHRNCA